MSIRFIHLADVHYDRENQDAAAKSIEAAIEAGKRERIDFWSLAGDLFNRGVQNSAGGGLPRLLDLIARMLAVAPIYAVSGTATHDLLGCYEALQKMGDFTLLAAGGVAYGMTKAGEKYMVLGLPEAGKEWFLAGANGLSADEANEKVKAGMRSILLGLGAKRAEHSEIPAIFIHHGMVAGAEMANGQLVEGGISIGREDLALVAPGIVAYYSGSAYPVNWGELDQKGFNIVELGAGATYGAMGHIHKAQRICGNEVMEGMKCTAFPFPHAPRKKIVVEVGEPLHELSSIFPQLGEVEDYQVWVVLKAPKGFEINLPWVEEGLLDVGALSGSRVTVETIPTETVRAAEITEKHHLREKAIVYAEASGEATPAESVLKKADALESAAAGRGAGQGAYIRLRKLRLRGAIGIWKGQRQDEIELDFDRFDPGLIALIGENGTGKTTLIENCHPYPCMLTREGKLQDHFRLRDSCRELTFVDERTGAEYRALIQIDGVNTTGKAEYHLFRNGEPLTNGRMEDYKEKIEAIFGSLALFLRSAFVSQRATKSNPDLAEATKGEKKEIFRELAGLDYLQAYTESAKGNAVAIEGEIELERARVNLIESQLTALPGIVSERAVKQKELGGRTEALTVIEARGRELKAKAEELAAKVREQELLAQRIASLEGQAAQQQQIIALAEKEIATYQVAVSDRPIAENMLAEHATLKEQEGAENERLSGIRAQRERIIADHHDKENAWHDACGKVEGDLSRLGTEKARVEGDRKVLQAQVAHLAGELAVPLKDACPTCGQMLPESTRLILHEKRAESEEKLCNLQENAATLDTTIDGLQKQIEAVVIPDAPPVPSLPPVDQAPLQRIRAALAGLNVERARLSLALAQQAATRLEETGKQRAKAEAEFAELTGKLEVARKQLDPLWAMEHGRMLIALEAARREYTEAQRVVATLEAQIESMRQRIEELEASERDLGERKVRTEEQACEAAEWRYLERACGADGIQALELDALGPSIAETTNRVLSSAYDTRFQIEIRTTRIAGRGAKTKQVEDFEIVVHDNEMLTEQSLDTLSGGESIWIKQALYAAFSIVRDRETGLRFLTCFKDECDGALDPESRQKYFRMLQAEHHESGRKHTVVITHSPEVQEMIGQRIVMTELARERIKV